MDVETVIPAACEFGEAPRWDERSRRLYWVDVPRGALHCLEHATGTHTIAHREDAALSACTLDEEGVLLFFAGCVVKRWRDAGITSVVELPGQGDSRFNDVAADARGRVLCGILSGSPAEGRLSVLDLDGSVRDLRPGLRMPNGIAFPAEDRVLWVDTGRKQIYAARYDLPSGALEAPTTFARVPGFPDGIALDEAGGVWCALWGGGAILRLDADGKETHRIPLPVRNVTALAFAGDALDELFITTAAAPDEALGGSLFRVRPPHRGRAPYRARLS